MDELERLDARIADNDAQGTPNAEWRAAHALYEKAEIVCDREGADAALSLYLEVARRLEHRTEPGPRTLRLQALYGAAVMHFEEGRGAESRRVAEALVERELDDAPDEAAVQMAWAVQLIARSRWEAGERDGAIELYERLIARFDEEPALWLEAGMDYAEAVFERDGGEAALPLFVELMRRHGERDEPEYVHAAWSVAYIHDAAGRANEARAVAAELVERHFDSEPPAAPRSVARAALLLARLRWEAGDRDRALTLLERVVERYGRPGVRGHRETESEAAVDAGAWLGDVGRHDEAVEWLDRAIAAVGDPGDDIGLQRTLVEALVRKARVLHELGRFADRDTICRRVLLRFGGSDDAYVAECAGIARTMLQEEPLLRGMVKGLARRLGPRR